MIYDISPPVDDAIGVWPDDTPPRRDVLLRLEDGDPVTLSTLVTTVHVGAHADAPSHYGLGAPPIDARDLNLYLGPCRVVRVGVGRGERIPADAVPGPVAEERVLLATGTFPDPTDFNHDFASLSPELIDRLHGQGVRLVGIDTPSVDPFDSKDLPSHQALLRNDMAILEGLVLDGVPEGVYELIALPLKLAGFDGSPVRAILRSLEP
jgi:arylformamidase